MKKSSIFAALVLGFTGALATVPALADSTLYTTLGPGGAYDSSSGWVVTGSNLGNFVVGNSFSLSSGGTVADAVLALGIQIGPDSPVSAYIESDNSGSPGSILSSLAQVGTIPSFYDGNGGGLVTFACSGAACDLPAGSYWLVAVESDPNTQVAWDMAYGDAETNFAYDYSGSPTGLSVKYTVGDAFQIDELSGPVVPEPSSFLLLASGLAGLAGMVRRKLLR